MRNGLAVNVSSCVFIVAAALGQNFPQFFELLTAPATKILDRWLESEPLKATLATDSVIGTMMILLKQEILFILVGGIFLAEILSVVLQDWIGIQRVGRRFLYRAPIHHQFKYQGLAETKVTVRLWIVSGILALIALASLKIR